MLANPPVQAPWPHTSTLIFAAAELDDPPLVLLLLHAAATSAIAATAATICRDAFRDKTPLLSPAASRRASYHKRQPGENRRGSPTAVCPVVRGCRGPRLVGSAEGAGGGTRTRTGDAQR